MYVHSFIVLTRSKVAYPINDMRSTIQQKIIVVMFFWEKWVFFYKSGILLLMRTGLLLINLSYIPTKTLPD